MRRSSCRAGLLVASATALVAGAAHAELHVERAADAEACPDPATFAQRAGDGLSDERKRSMGITVRFERTSSGFASAVRATDGSERTLDDRSSSCDGLAEATLLAVRLAFDRDDAAPPASPPAREERSAERQPRPRAAHAELLAGALGALGLGGSFGGRVVGAAVLGGQEEWSIGLTGFVFLRQTEQFGSGTVENSMVGGGLDTCRRARFERLLGGTMLALCGRDVHEPRAGTEGGASRAPQGREHLADRAAEGNAAARPVRRAILPQTFGTWCSKAGYDSRWVDRWLGHKPKGTAAKHYVKDTPHFEDVVLREPRPGIIAPFPPIPEDLAKRPENRPDNVIRLIPDAYECEGRDLNPYRSYPTGT